MTENEKERMLKTLLKARKAIDLACEEVAALFTDRAKWGAESETRCAIDAAYNSACAARLALDAAGFALDKEEATPDGEGKKENEED